LVAENTSKLAEAVKYMHQMVLQDRLKILYTAGKKVKLEYLPDIKETPSCILHVPEQSLKHYDLLAIKIHLILKSKSNVFHH